MKKILVVIDMQNDFITGSLGNDACKAVVPNVLKRMKTARKEGWHIICTKDVHEDNYLETGEGRRLPVKHCIRGTEGAELIDEIKNLEDEWNNYSEVFLKESPLEKSTFGTMELAKVLAGYEIEEIEIIGVCTDICVISNAMILRSAFPDIEVSVNEICCAGVTDGSHANALKAMEACQINISEH